MFRKIYFLLIAAALSAMLWLNACEWMKFPPAPVCQKQENEPVKQRMFTTDEGDADCVLTDNGTVEYRGRFRHRWWNYYNRAMCFAEKGCWEQAIEDFEKAIEQRGKDEKDQWDARTYGMRFMDYFPRREMGIAYYYLAKEKQETEEGYKTAVEKLEDSLSHTPTAKAIYYLEKVYKDWVALGGEQKPLVPEINVQPFWTKDEPVVLSGTVEDKKYIRKIGVNVTNKKNFRSYEKLEDESFEPVFILNGLEDFKRNLNENQLKLLEEQNTLTDLTTKVSFKKQFLFLPQGEYAVTIRAENIMGGSNDHKVDIRVDRLGPMIAIADKKYSDLDKRVTISGFLGDESGISSLFMNNQQVVVKADNSFEAEAKADEKEVELAAVDQLGNRTKISVSLASEDEEALHASAGMSDGNSFLLAQSDNPIQINLKTDEKNYLREGQEVFTNLFTLRIEIDSKEGVDSINIRKIGRREDVEDILKVYPHVKRMNEEKIRTIFFDYVIDFSSDNKKYIIEVKKGEYTAKKTINISPDFSMDEFRNPEELNKLCEKIKKDMSEKKSKENTGCDNNINTSCDNIETLNKILEIPNFYDCYYNKTPYKELLTSHSDINKLLEKTSNYRKRLFLYTDPDDEKRNSIKNLNRLILERVYHDITPNRVIKEGEINLKKKSYEALEIKNRLSVLVFLFKGNYSSVELYREKLIKKLQEIGVCDYSANETTPRLQLIPLEFMKNDFQNTPINPTNLDDRKKALTMARNLQQYVLERQDTGWRN
jgi:hypothetical protein